MIKKELYIELGKKFLRIFPVNDFRIA